MWRSRPCSLTVHTYNPMFSRKYSSSIIPEIIKSNAKSYKRTNWIPAIYYGAIAGVIVSSYSTDTKINTSETANDAFDDYLKRINTRKIARDKLE